MPCILPDRLLSVGRDFKRRMAHDPASLSRSVFEPALDAVCQIVLGNKHHRLAVKCRIAGTKKWAAKNTASPQGGANTLMMSDGTNIKRLRAAKSVQLRPIQASDAIGKQ